MATLQQKSKRSKLALFSLLFLALLSTFVWAGKKEMQAELSLIRAGLTDGDREVRIIAAESLGLIGDKESIQAIKEMLGDSNDLVRIKAAVALAHLGETTGIPELRKILQTKPKLSEHPTPLERVKAVARGTVRVAAANALAELRDKESLPLLKEMSGDQDGRVADACIIAAAKLGSGSSKNEFISALESTKQEVRAKSAEALGEIGDATCYPALRKRLKDWDRDTKVSAMIALAKLKDTASIPVLREMLWDKDEIIREKAATALGIMASPETATINAMKKVLEDPNGMVRLAAVDALAKLGDDSGKDFLLRAIETGDKDAKLKALAILPNLAAPKDILKVQALLSDNDKTLAIAAAKAIVLTKNRAQH